MRRKNREVTNETEIRAILDDCKVMRVGMRDEMGIYVVPLNFAYRWADGRLSLFFHGAKVGRKADALQKDPEVGFEMDRGGYLVEGQVPCGFSYAYESVVGSGAAVSLTDMNEKIDALTLVMRHQTGRDFEIDARMANAVNLYRIDVREFAVKRNPPKKEGENA